MAEYVEIGTGEAIEVAAGDLQLRVLKRTVDTDGSRVEGQGDGPVGCRGSINAAASARCREVGHI